MDHAGWMVVGGIVLSLISALGGRLSVKDKCGNCGIGHLRHDIRVQFFMIRHLAQKQGTTNEELLQIEALANQAMQQER